MLWEHDAKFWPTNSGGARPGTLKTTILPVRRDHVQESTDGQEVEALVQHLARRSQDVARDTAALIERSRARLEEGARCVEASARSLAAAGARLPLNRLHF